MKLLHSTSAGWRRWRFKWPVIIVLVIGISIFVGLTISQQREHISDLPETRLNTQVTVQTLNELAQQGTIIKTAIVEPASAAPLIARTGGRVTGLLAQLGDQVGRGQSIAQIDGGVEGNPTRAQIASATASLGIFDSVRQAGLASAQNAIRLAEINASAASTGQGLTVAQAKIARQLADNAAESSRLALQDVRDSGSDQVIRAADLADQAAQLVQNQARLALRQSNQQTGDAIKVAEKNVAQARLAANRLLAELDNQRNQITLQLTLAQEQFKLQQISAPISGQVTKLKIRVGDFVTPGQTVGEINAVNGARLTLEVATGIRQLLTIGDQLRLSTSTETFTGSITNLAGAPDSATGLWQIEVFIAETPSAISTNELVNVHLPSNTTNNGTVFLPLDALTVRQAGVVIFTVDENNIAREHQVQISAFESHFAEVVIDLPDTTKIVIDGNRLLRDGDEVELAG
ncbi:HlyD family efflux transporter periplasmic adaptor subunit [Patescibacteria group bacterium]|nr:HlyD family efflux transporter periplasmic adaptor subunit [Patescibacteria group bacterium]